MNFTQVKEIKTNTVEVLFSYMILNIMLNFTPFFHSTCITLSTMESHLHSYTHSPPASYGPFDLISTSCVTNCSPVNCDVVQTPGKCDRVCCN